jgi:hypothetical protein
MARSSAIGFAILSERSFLGLGKGYITKEALDTPWCHYQTIAPTQEGEKPAPEAKNDREKDPLKFGISSRVLPTPPQPCVSTRVC